jgi:hypothetical protein
MTIKQIIPAQPGVVARFSNPSGEDYELAVLLWVISDDEVTSVSEGDGSVFDTEAENFDGWYIKK